MHAVSELEFEKVEKPTEIVLSAAYVAVNLASKAASFEKFVAKDVSQQ